MKGLVNSLQIFIASFLNEEKDSLYPSPALEKKKVTLRGNVCFYFLSYRAHKPLLFALKRGDERALRIIRKDLFENLKTISPTATVIPLPQSFLKNLKRCYNAPTLIIERALSFDKEKNFKLEKRVLVKSKETRKQANLSLYERRTEQIGAFKVRNENRITGETIMLFDDIVTTGSTLAEAKDVLLSAGAKRVICVALAH